MNPRIAKQNAAAVEAFLLGKPIQFKHACAESGWMDFLLDGPSWDFVRYHYRPKHEPIAVPWSKPEHVPGPVCYLRRKENPVGWTMIVAASDIGVCMWNSVASTREQIGIFRHEWEYLKYAEYSTDRVNWFPCTVMS